MSAPEAWLRGDVREVPAVLQPVAHALVQARDEVRELVADFPDALLWTRPHGVASVGFHLQHMSGVIDRLFTYARGESLTAEQRAALSAEGRSIATNARELSIALDARVEQAIESLRRVDPGTLTERRTVGRAQLPSTVLGLLFHTAEHVQRHLGQLLVTVRVQRPSND